MGVLDRIRERRQKLANPVQRDISAGSNYGWGHDPFPWTFEDDSKFVDRAATADDLMAVVGLRARLMSGLKLRIYRGRGNTRTEVTAGPAYETLMHVNPFWSPLRLARMDELSMGLWGQSFWAVEKDRDGVPREIWWVKPTRMVPVPDSQNYIRGFLYHPVNGGPPIPFAPDEVVWFRYPNPLDEMSPLSPLIAAQRAAETGEAMLESNLNLFRQGLMVGGFVVPAGDKVSFSQQQADDLERFLERRFKGKEGAHRWAVLRFDAQFKESQVSPKDAEFVNGLNVTLRRICNVYGVPSPLLNDLEYATLANVNELHKILWMNALVPDAQLRASEITEQFLPMFPGRTLHAEFDFTQVDALHESATSVWDRERQQIEAGSITINEWREKHGMPPVPWGDVWWAPVNKSAVNGPTSTAPEETVPEDQAANALAALDLFHMDFKYGPLTLNGHKINGNGHGRVR